MKIKYIYFFFFIFSSIQAIQVDSISKKGIRIKNNKNEFEDIFNQCSLRLTNTSLDFASKDLSSENKSFKKNVFNLRNIKNIDFNSRISVMSYSSDNKFIAIGFCDGFLKIYTFSEFINSFNLSNAFFDQKVSDQEIIYISWSNKDKCILVADAFGKIKVYEIYKII